jgi:N-acetylmuramic acid 6-phosphate (MurNAc-6-P) etherase
MGCILNYLKITPSPQSVDFIRNKKQFHLYNLLTEQRHPKTMNLSSAMRNDARNGLKMLLSVDDDVVTKMEEIVLNMVVPEQAADAVYRAVIDRRKIYFYGCGATGRLAKQMESTFWRPFWKRMQESSCWEKLQSNIPDDIADRLIGEMTGGDRAMISSLEGFEDLQVIGRLQLADRGIEKGDVVFCVTEGGETSSVIGTILAALEQYGDLNQKGSAQASKNLYFVYNNPDQLLLSIDRSREVVENPGITKLNLTTGPQAITGSTRMQATTSETFMLGAILEEAIFRMLRELLTEHELSEIGFDPDISFAQRLLSFKGVRKGVENSIDALVRLTELETETYRTGHFTTCFAKKALSTVFIDSTERSPTFRLFPVDTVLQVVRRSWIQILTEAENGREAWQVLLGREFRGLEEVFYKTVFLSEIEDAYLREAALKSLANAGNDQEGLYDLSFTVQNKQLRGPGKGDLGVVVCLSEEYDEWGHPESCFREFCRLFMENGGKVAIITVNSKNDSPPPGSLNADVSVNLLLPGFPDPLGLRKQIAVKMLLNAHSTGVMASLGRVIGNTMTNVNPGNLKLIGRATALVMLHVNDILSHQDWIAGHGEQLPVTFEEVNAVLFDAMEYVRHKNQGQTAEVALCIVRILEAMKIEAFESWEEAHTILGEMGLEGYMKAQGSRLKAQGSRRK